MPGPAPKENRRRRNLPARGEWQPTKDIGWQHGEIPEPPDGLIAASVEAWRTWFGSWFAAHWTPDDLPGLQIAILQYDKVRRGGAKAADESALHTSMRSYGITPDGQMALRWQRPTDEETEPSQPQRHRADEPEPYSHLKVVGE